MANQVRYVDKKIAIRDALLKSASSGNAISYSELGKLVGIPAQGPWKPVLDIIAKEETSAGRPDITFLVIKKSTGLPGQIGFEPAQKPTPEQRQYAAEELEKVFQWYSTSDGN